MADNQINNKKRGRPKITVKKKRNLHFLNSIQLPTSNRFSALANGDTAMQTDETQQQTEKNRISPIVVTDHQTDLQAILNPLNVNYNFKLNSVGRKILPTTIDDKNKIIASLKDKKIYFFTHPEKNSKAFKVILSGLPQVDTSLITTSLAEQNLTPSKITMFNTKSSNKLYLLHFDAAQVNKKTLETVKYVYHHAIKWLPYKPKRNGPTICMRCCMYGHGIQSCNRYVVCMLCAGDHLTKDCTTHTISNDTNTNTIYSCFNCKSANLQHNHKANAAICPFRLKYETARNNARNKTTTNERSQANTARYAQAPAPPPLRVSFADSMRTPTASTSQASTTHNTQSRAQTNARFNNTSSHSNPNDNFNTNTNNNLWSFDECADLLLNSIEQLRKCQNKFDQLQIIANLLRHACK